MSKFTLSQLALAALLVAWSAGTAEAQPPTPGIGDIANLASFSMRISPGSMVRILG